MDDLFEGSKKGWSISLNDIVAAKVNSTSALDEAYNTVNNRYCTSGCCAMALLLPTAGSMVLASRGG